MTNDWQSSLISFDQPAAPADVDRRWNELWEQSDSKWPLSRWGQIDLWRRTFANGRRMAGIVIEREGRWVAALPIVSRRIFGLLSGWELAYSDWTGSLEMLVAADVAHEPGVYDALLAAFSKVNACAFRMGLVAADSAIHSGWLGAAGRAGLPVDMVHRYEVGIIDICGPRAPESWQAYQASWSGNFRRQMRKMLKRAEKSGGVELVVHRPQNFAEAAPLVRTGFSIEDRSWKGREGTSVLRAPGMLEYFERQAGLLAERGELVLLFLRRGEDLISFEYGWSCRRVYYSPKVGYDERFRQLSPGQLLLWLWMERLFQDQTHDMVDFAGPLAEATQKWITRRYSMQKVLTGFGATGWGAIAATRLGRTARRCAKSSGDRIWQSIQRILPRTTAAAQTDSPIDESVQDSPSERRSPAKPVEVAS